MNIVICSPANRFTGGPTLAHQLCKTLIRCGYNAQMYYYHKKKGQPLVHDRYAAYKLPYIGKIPNDSNTVVVVPETAPDILKKCSKCIKVIWWMSVDNYYDKYLSSRRNKVLNLGGLIKYDVFKGPNYHFVQSEYARDFLNSKGISDSVILPVSDYLDDCFLTIKSPTEEEKSNLIAYSPKRGLQFTEKIIQMNSQYKYVRLENMTQEEMIEKLKHCKLYLDFGNHPGKDRIPREAAMCGCCLLTCKRGSAGNAVDIPISDNYKFDDKDENLEKISMRIRDIMENYSIHSLSFEDYRNTILSEKELFEQSARRAIQIISESK